MVHICINFYNFAYLFNVKTHSKNITIQFGKQTDNKFDIYSNIN